MEIRDVLEVTPIDEILKTTSAAKKSGKKFFRDGVELNKGAVLSKRLVDEKRDFFEKVCEHFSIYPDRYIDLIKPVDSKFQIKFYQRVFMRCVARFSRFFVVAPRAFSKSFLSMLTMYLLCMFRSGIKLFLCAPKKEQGAKICTEKLNEIWELYPLLKKEVMSQNMGADYVRIIFKNGSILDVVSALNSQRGGRRHYGLIDEVRDHDVTALNEVVLPLMNVSRRMKNGEINPHEPHQGQLWMSSASGKNTFCYDKAIETLEMSIVQPNRAIIWGCDVRVPIDCGLVSKEYINEIKTNKTYSESSFARE